MSTEGASTTEVLIVPTGAANLASVTAAFARAEARAHISSDPRAIDGAALVVVPGVGSFGAAMASLRESGADSALAARVRAGRPTLGICLGMQVMFDSSEESPDVAGLGLIPGRVERFAEPTGESVWRVPQMGWNRVDAGPDSPIQPPHHRVIQSGAAYFANSYRAAEAPAGWAPATAEHGGRFIAGLERGAVVLCQFHPELSGPWGLSLIQRWLAPGRKGPPC